MRTFLLRVSVRDCPCAVMWHVAVQKRYYPFGITLDKECFMMIRWKMKDFILAWRVSGFQCSNVGRTRKTWDTWEV